MSPITALIAFALVQFVLTLMLCVINLGPRINKEIKALAHLDRAIVPLFFLYLLMATYSALTATRLTVWFLFSALLVGVLVLTSMTGKSLRKVTLIPALLMPIVVIFLSLLISGLVPIVQDEGLFTGLAYRIIADEKWQSGIYTVANYYQFFPVIPYLESIISIVTGANLIYLVHPLIVLVVTLLVSLSVYVILKNPRFMRGAGGGSVAVLGILGPILFFSAPSLSTLGFVPQVLATALFLTSLTVVSIQSSAKSTFKKSLILVTLISVVGVITHATYPLFLLLTLFSLLFASHELAERPSEVDLLRSAIRILIVFTLAYWTYTLILDSLVINYGKPWIQSLMELFTGDVKPFQAGRQVWYTLGPAELTYPLASLPALAAAYIFTKMIPGLRSFTRARSVVYSLRRDALFVLGATGLFLIGLAFITRASPGVGFPRYLNSAYILLIPASAAIISKIASKKRVINTILIVIIIAMTSFYAIQNPLLSPDVNEIMGLANKRSWNVAQTLVPYISPDVKYQIDQRVGIAFEALTVKSAPAPAKSEFTKELGSLAILNLDEYGKAWVNTYLGDKVLKAIENDTYDVVYSDGLYKMYVISP